MRRGGDASSFMSEEFTRVVREVGLGISPQDAMDHLLRRIQSEDLDLLVTAINIQHEVGGNLA
jgi:tight adherence protein B